MRNQPLARLFEKFRTEGSTAALARVFDLSAPALLRVARRLTRDLAQAEDAVQSTFLAAIERAHAWDAARPLEPWLFGILVRQVGLLRRSAARVVDPGRIAVAPPEDPATAAERSELVAAVDTALQELSERDREVLRPWLAGEARGVELADRLGVGGSTLRMRLQRGLARLRRALPVGFGAGVVLTAAERRALAAARTIVLANAARPGVALVAASSLAAKFVAAALVVVIVGGGVVLFQATRPSTSDLASHASPGAAAATVAQTPSPVNASRNAEPVAPAATNDSGRDHDDAAGAITTTATPVSIVTPTASTTGLEIEVVGEDRTPVANARLRLFDDASDRAGACAEGTTAADGTFRIALATISSLHVVVEHAGLARAVAVTMAPGRTTLTMTKGVTVTGTITGEDGAPVANATLSLADETTRFVGPRMSTADATGRYAFDHVAKRVLWIRALSPDPVETARAGFIARTSAAPLPTSHADIVVRPRAQLTFAITSAEEGRPIEQALVVVHGGPDSTKSKDAEFRGASGFLDLDPFGSACRTNRDGEVAFLGTPAAVPVRIAVAAKGFAPVWRELAPLQSGEERRESFALGRACTVIGTARNRDGSPLAKARVAVVPFDPIDELRSAVFDTSAENPFLFETTSGDDGTFRLEGLPPLTRHLLRVDANHRVAFAPLDLPHAGDVAEGVVLTLGAKVKIEGTIVAEDGPLPKGTQLWLQPTSELAAIDAQGRFEFEFIPKREATVWAVAPGYVHAKAEVEAPLADVNHVEITLRRGLSIEGRVEDAAHHAVAAARVIAWPADPTAEESARSGGWITEIHLAATTSEADGTFELRGLPERAVRLVVKSDGFDEVALDRLEPGARDVAVTLTRTR